MNQTKMNKYSEAEWAILTAECDSISSDDVDESVSPLKPIIKNQPNQSILLHQNLKSSVGMKKTICNDSDEIAHVTFEDQDDKIFVNQRKHSGKLLPERTRFDESSDFNPKRVARQKHVTEKLPFDKKTPSVVIMGHILK